MTSHPIIVFDGDCVMCSAGAQFVLDHDRAAQFRLAAMQGAAGIALFRRFGIDPDDPETMLLVEGETVYRNSDAILGIASGLGWPWKALGLLRIVPRFVRDPLYRLVARNRRRIFGQRESCWVPRPDQAERIL